MTLAELQRQMAGAILAPLGRTGDSARAEAAELIKPNTRLTSVERLEIYGRSYWARVLDSFREDFPGLRAVLGPRVFERLAAAYLREMPSQSFTLRDLGLRLEEWLQKRPEMAGRSVELALDMVRLEWAHIEAYDSEERKALGPEDLLELGPEMRFDLQPHLRLLAVSHSVDELRIQVEEQIAGTGRLQARRAPAFLAVHRVEFSVYYKRLASEEFRILEALRSGSTLGEALADVPPDCEPSVEGWFAAWSRLGWLCAPERRTG
jgi:hypothetical protein